MSLSKMFFAGSALLVTTAGCLSEPDDSASQTGEVESEIAGQTYLVPASGQEIALCGSANLASTNAYLATHGVHVVANLSSDFPTPYWGINNTDAYICINGYHYHASKWKNGTYSRNGEYSAFDVEIQGFATNAAGVRTDTNGDGVVDLGDLITYQQQIFTDGALSTHDPLDMAFFYQNVFGADANPNSVALGNYTAAQYPTNLSVGTGSANQLWAQLANNNHNRCAASGAAWETCWFFDGHSGDEWYAFPGNTVSKLKFTNNGNNWVKFDSIHDTFVTAGALNTLLTSLDFHAKFWITANATSQSYTSP